MAELRLQQLGALQAPPQNIPLRELEKIQYCSAVTALGRCITNFPVAPRFGKMLALAHQHSLLPLALTLVSALTVQEVLIETELTDSADPAGKERKLPGRLRQLRKEWAGSGHCLHLGDPMVLLQGCIAAEREGYCQQWCASHGLRAKGQTNSNLVTVLMNYFPSSHAGDQKTEETAGPGGDQDPAW